MKTTSSCLVIVGLLSLCQGNRVKRWDEDGNGDGGMTGVHGQPGVDYPDYKEVPKTSFSCKDQLYAGLYADVETQCQAYHVCYPQDRVANFLCARGTVFNQKILACDYWYNVECEESPNYYYLNGRTEDVSQQLHTGSQPQQQNGYQAQQQTGYQPQQTGYQPQQTGYQPQQETGYQPQQTGYQPQQTGYQPQPGSQPQQQTGFQTQPGSRPEEQTGYQIQGTGYQPQPGPQRQQQTSYQHQTGYQPFPGSQPQRQSQYGFNPAESSQTSFRPNPWMFPGGMMMMGGPGDR
ncbi:actin cytoskeleton-regulatory complex protein pan-1-like isoform X2 [Limulus polyphemus]|uniref:Actin cytoskeleton-regulatory complex protein pan-1-like isoform X2 n=1 Tax=Limulus polyphemus TaxID=6850 RepID=A0ABM1TFI7_LIMPO|nr:actin cytoskeleton-regulatory complex protein pan-1-like isoform X2 [Limulus polyphemus]